MEPHMIDSELYPFVFDWDNHAGFINQMIKFCYNHNTMQWEAC